MIKITIFALTAFMFYACDNRTPELKTYLIQVKYAYSNRVDTLKLESTICPYIRERKHAFHPAIWYETYDPDAWVPEIIHDTCVGVSEIVFLKHTWEL